MAIETSVFLQTALAAVTHLTEGLTLAQCRASTTEQSLINLEGIHNVTVSRMEEQQVLVIRTFISDRVLRCCHVD